MASDARCEDELESHSAPLPTSIVEKSKSELIESLVDGGEISICSCCSCRAWPPTVVSFWRVVVFAPGLDFWLLGLPMRRWAR